MCLVDRLVRRGIVNERQPLQDRLQMHDLSREDLRQGEPDNVRRSGCDIEVDRHPGTARGGQPVQHGLAGVAQIVRDERADAPVAILG